MPQVVSSGIGSNDGDRKAIDDDKAPGSEVDGVRETSLVPNGTNDESLRSEVILLVQQLCVMGKNVQLPARMALFRSLVDRGILFAVQWALDLADKPGDHKSVVSAGGEILAALLDHDINGVRGHVLKQVIALEKERNAGKKGADKAQTILEMACRVMAESKDSAVQSLVGDALKVWLDLPPELGSSGGASEAHVRCISVINISAESHYLKPAKPPVRKDDPGTERFMDYFYKDCIKILFSPFDQLPEWGKCPGL